jgi:disease resistance protein RPM1
MCFFLFFDRCLLLIDDIWSSSTWQKIKKCFPPDNDKGSRIIVTTRFQAVATTCSPRKDHDMVHKVDVLSGDEPRKLFDKSLFECKGIGDSQPITSQHSTPPSRVWEMCGGLPLAIITMAGLVASKPLETPKDWKKVCDSLFPESQVCRKPEDFMRIINHCYSCLPSDLKTCALYLSIFPKGRKISRKRLIRRWIAEGFISEKQGLSVEDVAETCFNQLVRRKMIRPVEHSSNGRVKSCQVHDMVLEYIISRAAEEDFVTVVGSHWSMSTRSSNKVRRLSIHNSDPENAKKANSMNLSRVRSLTVFGSIEQLRLRSFKTEIVQVLDLEGCRGFKKNRSKVDDICEMILLKYLSLRRTDITILPPSISQLKYLETLDIRETEIEDLPETVGKLEHINNILGGNKRTRKALKLCKELKGTMRSLRILSGIEIVEITTASNLGYFTGLRKLEIYRLHNSEEVHKELLSSIQYLSGYALQTLVINDESSDFLKTLDSMTSHPAGLSSLELSGKLLKIPKWLPYLQDLIKLNLSATVLRTDTLVLLRELPSLFSLTFSITEKQDASMVSILEKNKCDSGGEIFVPAGGFGKLKLLRIFVPLLPSLNFAMNATPQLERIELRFKRLEGLHSLDKLERLHDVLLTVHDQANQRTKLIVEGLKKKSTVENFKNGSPEYTLIVNEYHD